MWLDEEGGHHFEMVDKDFIQICEELVGTISKSEQMMMTKIVDLEIRVE